MILVIEQVLTLFAFFAVGFALTKARIVKTEHTEILSKLLVYVFLPSNIVKTFAKYCTLTYIGQNYTFILASIAVIAVLIISAHFLAKLMSKKKSERAVYEYSLIIPNFGYMGYTFAESLFGAQGLMNAMMFAIPMSVYTYTAGYCRLSGKRVSLKNLVNPTMIALVTGIVLGLSGIGDIMPSGVYGFLNRASGCMAPTSMLLTGVVISEINLIETVKKLRVYIISALRLLVIPIAIGLALSLIGNQEITKAALVLYCMPCGLNTVVFVKNSGGDCTPGAELALISNILACLTIPVIMYFFM